MIHPLRHHDPSPGSAAMNGSATVSSGAATTSMAPVASGAPSVGASMSMGPVVGPLVIKLGGLAVDEPAKAPWLWSLLRDLHDRHPGGLVLVHGGAVAVDRQLARLGLASTRREGIRVTPEEQIDDIVGVLAGSVNTALVGWLRRCGAPSVGLTLGDGGLCTVARTSRYDFDAGCVGEIVGGDPRVIDALLNIDLLPVLCSIGLDAEGRPLNVNADDAAAGVAGIVGASGVLLLTDVPGVRGADGAVIPSLDAAAIDRLVAEGVITGGMIPKVRGALDAARIAKVPVTIAAWNDETSLRRLAAGQPAGTRVLPPGVDSPAARLQEPLQEPEMPALSSSAASVAPGVGAGAQSLEYAPPRCACGGSCAVALRR